MALACKIMVSRGIGCSLDTIPQSSSTESLEVYSDHTRLSLFNSTNKWKTRRVRSSGSFSASYVALSSQRKLRETIKNANYTSESKTRHNETQNSLRPEMMEVDRKLDEAARHLLEQITSEGEMKQELRDIFVKDMTMKGGDETKGVFVVDLDSTLIQKKGKQDGEGLSALFGQNRVSGSIAQVENNREFIRPIDDLLKSLSVLSVGAPVDQELSAPIEEVIATPASPQNVTEDKEEGLNADEIDDLLREASIYPNENSTQSHPPSSSLAGQIPLVGR